MSKELEKVLESSSMAKGDGWKVMAKGVENAIIPSQA